MNLKTAIQQKKLFRALEPIEKAPHRAIKNPCDPGPVPQEMRPKIDKLHSLGKFLK